MRYLLYQKQYLKSVLKYIESVFSNRRSIHFIDIFIFQKFFHTVLSNEKFRLPSTAIYYSNVIEINCNNLHVFVLVGMAIFQV